MNIETDESWEGWVFKPQGMVIERAQRWGSKGNLLGYWGVGIKARDESHVATLVEDLEGCARGLALALKMKGNLVDLSDIMVLESRGWQW